MKFNLWCLEIVSQSHQAWIAIDCEKTEVGKAEFPSLELSEVRYFGSSNLPQALALESHLSEVSTKLLKNCPLFLHLWQIVPNNAFEFCMSCIYPTSMLKKNILCFLMLLFLLSTNHLPCRFWKQQINLLYYLNT